MEDAKPAVAEDASAVGKSAEDMSVEVMAAAYVSAESCNLGHEIQSLGLLALCLQKPVRQEKACEADPEGDLAVREPF